MVSLYTSLWRTFAADIPQVDPRLSLTGDLLASAFCCMIAWDLKPYGPETTGLTLAAILASPTLACSGYVSLAWHFIQLFGFTNLRIIAVGWEGGTVGNHAQMLVTNGNEWLFLDPTIGFVARHVTYNDVAAGKPIDMTKTNSFYGKFGGSAVVANLNGEVQRGLANGLYRPSDCLYYTEKLSFYENLPPEPKWPTPAAAKYQV